MLWGIVDSYLLLPEKVPKILTNGYIFEKMQTSKLEKKGDGKFRNYSPCSLQEPPYALWILLPHWA